MSHVLNNLKYTNFATTTLGATLLVGGTSLTVATGSGTLFPTISGTKYFYVTLSNNSGNVEIIKVTARSGDSFSTIVRAQKGTTARQWEIGDAVQLRWNSAYIDDMLAEITVSDPISVIDYGAYKDGTNAAATTTAINNAVTAAAALGGGIVYFPAGNYHINAAISVGTGKGIVFMGEGPYKTVITQESGTENGFVITNTGSQSGGGVVGMTVKGNSATGTGSTGIGVLLVDANDNTIIDNVDISNFDTCIELRHCWNVFISRFRCLYFATAGINIPDGYTLGGGDHVVSGKISNNGFTGNNTASVGIRIRHSGGGYYHGIDITSINEGVRIDPPAASIVAYLFFSQVLADTSTATGWFIDGTATTTYSIHCHDCWAGYNGSHGVATLGTNLQDFVWTGGRIRENAGNGWRHTGGTRCTMNGTSIASNSRGSTNTWDGVYIGANVSGWKIQNCTIGNFASAFNDQAHGIYIAVGASENFIINGCDLRDQGAGKFPISINTSSNNWIIKDNLPLLFIGNNISNKTVLTSCSTVAAPATVYLGPTGSGAAADDSVFVIGSPAVVFDFLVAVDTPPGAGKSFTYTVFKNGASTGYSGTITGAVDTSVYVNSSTFAVASGDYLTLQLVADAGSAQAKHRFYIGMHP